MYISFGGGPVRSVSELEDDSFEKLGLVGSCLFGVGLLEWVDHGLDVFAVDFDAVEEVEDLVVRLVRQHEHVLRQRLDQRHQAPLGVEPGVRAELSVEGLETLNNPADPEVIVALGAVKRADDKVDDAKMEYWRGWVLDRHAVFLLFDTFHHFFGVRILARHDVGDAEVREHDGGDAEQIVHLLSDEWFVVSDGVSELVVLHEEHVGNIKLPCLMLTAELGRLSEDFFNLEVISLIPIGFCLHHEHRDVLVERSVVILQGLRDCFGVSGDSGVLDRFRLFSEAVDVGVAKFFEFGVGFVS